VRLAVEHPWRWSFMVGAGSDLAFCLILIPLVRDRPDGLGVLAAIFVLGLAVGPLAARGSIALAMYVRRSPRGPTK
jgi:hypothetical protein